MKAMIMAAGKGTRLGKISETVPKSLLVINGKSLLVMLWKTAPPSALMI